MGRRAGGGAEASDSHHTANTKIAAARTEVLPRHVLPKNDFTTGNIIGCSVSFENRSNTFGYDS